LGDQFKFVAKALNSALVNLQWPLANPVLNTKVCRSPGSSSLQLKQLCIWRGMPISTVNVHKSQHLST